jgi:hypothetical protein
LNGLVASLGGRADPKTGRWSITVFAEKEDPQGEAAGNGSSKTFQRLAIKDGNFVDISGGSDNSNGDTNNIKDVNGGSNHNDVAHDVAGTNFEFIDIRPSYVAQLPQLLGPESSLVEQYFVWERNPQQLNDPRQVDNAVRIADDLLGDNHWLMDRYEIQYETYSLRLFVL